MSLYYIFLVLDKNYLTYFWVKNIILKLENFFLYI
jgi:hypothetical protein